MSRHTKGPWHVGEMRAGQIAIKRGDGSHFVLADVDAMYTADVAEAEANARLIAAAPDLLDMLQQYDEAVVAGTQCFFCATSPHLSRCGLTELIRRAGGDLAPEGEV